MFTKIAGNSPQKTRVRPVTASGSNMPLTSKRTVMASEIENTMMILRLPVFLRIGSPFVATAVVELIFKTYFPLSFFRSISSWVMSDSLIPRWRK